MPAKRSVNGTKLDANEEEIIHAATTSDDAREVTVHEIAAARLEGDHKFADRLQVLLDEAERIRKRERAAPFQGESAQRPSAVPMGR